MANPLNNPHDKFFRSSMQNAPIAKAFFRQHLPITLSSALDLDSFRLENATYIDKRLQETFSDLVFTCHYSEGKSKGETADSSQANVILLVEHQSTPEPFMAFRVYHYLFNMLYSRLKGRSNKRANDKLPPVYALVFYHCEQTPYPFLMHLKDCFDDPLNLMDKMFNEPVPLVDVNQFNDDDIKKQQLLGIMTGALKHSRDQDIGQYLIWLMSDLKLMDLEGSLALNFINSVLNYLLKVGNIANVQQFVANAQQLPEPVKGEFMTAAEKLMALGRDEKQEEVAINALNEGADPRFVARITGLDLAVIEGLKAGLSKPNDN
jgi:predicted transposase/invertase (TIGR01784 family)